MSEKLLLEICAESLDCAAAAERANADRIELCSNLAAGGTTPSAGIMEAARRHLNLPIHVLIRPRPGDFVYSALEFEVMQNDVRVAKQHGMNGIAVGMLDSGSRIDITRMRQLVDLARPLQVTFHRAFDHCGAAQRRLEQVIETGVDRILSSGCAESAADGVVILAQLVKEANGRVKIMPGGGVTLDNIAQILRATGATEIHASLGASVGENGSPQKTLKLIESAEYEERVRKVSALLNSLSFDV